MTDWLQRNVLWIPGFFVIYLVYTGSVWSWIAFMAFMWVVLYLP